MNNHNQQWNKPHYANSRFGFEVTMYIGLAPNPTPTPGLPINRFSKRSLCLLTALLLGAGNAFAGQTLQSTLGAWQLSGFDGKNHADSSTFSNLNKSNVNNLKLQWIYNIPPIPLTAPGTCGVGSNPSNNERPAFGASNAVSVDPLGLVYFPTFDGRMLMVDAYLQSPWKNPDGTYAPFLLLDMDLFADPQYIKANETPGAEVYVSRMFPTIINNSVYAGNFGLFGTLTVNPPGLNADKAIHTTSPTNLQFKSAGAVLYSLNRLSGALNWKTVVDSNPESAIGATGATPIFGTPVGDILIVPFGASNISGTSGTFPVSRATTPATDPFGGHCCDGRGGIAAIRMSDGKVMWKTYTVPKQNFPTTEQAIANGGINAWTGSNMWGGGSFPYSQKLNMVYSGTSESYSAPLAASACELARLQAGGATISTECLHYSQTGPIPKATYNDNVVEATSPYQINSPTLPFPDTIYGVDASTGKIKWAQPTNGFDVWNLSCLAIYGYVNGAYFCPNYLSFDPTDLLQFNHKDVDAAAAPVLIENVTMSDGSVHDVIIGAGKAQTFFAYDAATGAPLWTPVNIGPGGINGGGFVWGLATDGTNIYGSSGRYSNITLSDLTKKGNPKHIVLDGSCIASGFDPVSGLWQGGMYAAVNIASGQIAWQRCAIGLKGTPNRPLTTLTPVADCISGKAAVTSPNDICAADGVNAPPSVSNGVLIVPGTNNYFDGGEAQGTLLPFGEALLLDASTGNLLRELPMGVLNQPSSNMITYNRSIAAGNHVFMSSGSYQGISGVDPTAPFNRVVMFDLPF